MCKNRTLISFSLSLTTNRPCLLRARNSGCGRSDRTLEQLLFQVFTKNVVADGIEKRSQTYADHGQRSGSLENHL